MAISNRRRHLQTIKLHRKHVRYMCWHMGLFWQGLVHDLSKYSRKEMSVAKYADGTRSPHEICREKMTYSPSWNHHYHKNKHHWQYWVDEMENFKSAKMPYKYVVEMFCDMVGASKAYKKENYKRSDPYDYYLYRSPGLKKFMHSESQELLIKLFERYSRDASEEFFFEWYKLNKHELYKKYTDEVPYL